MKPVTTRLSSKGQIVIPASIREEMGLHPGTVLRVEVRREGDRAIVLRPRSPEAIEDLLEKGYRWIEDAGVDLVEDLHAARRKERIRERRKRRP
jgi:AbrB family looped-hinge helix DNA binding protein